MWFYNTTCLWLCMFNGVIWGVMYLSIIVFVFNVLNLSYIYSYQWKATSIQTRWWARVERPSCSVTSPGRKMQVTFKASVCKNILYKKIVFHSRIHNVTPFKAKTVICKTCSWQLFASAVTYLFQPYNLVTSDIIPQSYSLYCWDNRFIFTAKQFLYSKSQ